MKSILHATLLSLLLSLWPVLSAHAEKKPLVEIDVAAFVYPPFSFIDDEGQWQGADIEIMTAALKAIGYKPNFKNLPFKRLLLSLKEGWVPMSVPIVEGNGREDYVYFSDPISYLFNVLWKRNDRDIAWDSYEDLAGLHIGATKGYHYGAGFKEAGDKGVLDIHYMADTQPEYKNFKKVVAHRLDMFICEINVGRYIQNQHAPKFDEVDYAPKGVGPKRPFSLAISKEYFKDNPNMAKRLLKDFNLALKAIEVSGENKKIFKKYNMDIDVDEYNRPVIAQNWRESAER